VSPGAQFFRLMYPSSVVIELITHADIEIFPPGSQCILSSRTVGFVFLPVTSLCI
jgi:hypothetical protein